MLCVCVCVRVCVCVCVCVRTGTVDQALRGVIAALLKHCHLVGDAMAFATSKQSTPSDELKRAYRYGYKIKKWFIQQRQRQASSLTASGERELKKSGEDGAEVSKDLYRPLAEGVLAKAHALLQFFREAISSVRARPPCDAVGRLGGLLLTTAAQFKATGELPGSTIKAMSKALAELIRFCSSSADPYSPEAEPLLLPQRILIHPKAHTHTSHLPPILLLGRLMAPLDLVSCSSVVLS